MYRRCDTQVIHISSLYRSVSHFWHLEKMRHKSACITKMYHTVSYMYHIKIRHIDTAIRYGLIHDRYGLIHDRYHLPTFPGPIHAPIWTRYMTDTHHGFHTHRYATDTTLIHYTSQKCLIRVRYMSIKSDRYVCDIRHRI